MQFNAKCARCGINGCHDTMVVCNKCHYFLDDDDYEIYCVKCTQGMPLGQYDYINRFTCCYCAKTPTELPKLLFDFNSNNTAGNTSEFVARPIYAEFGYAANSPADSDE